MTGNAVSVCAILDEDVPAVARFLHRQLNARVQPASWESLLRPPWRMDAPNSGFQLTIGEELVGAYAAVYSVRELDGERVEVCNLAAFCVLEEYRSHSLRLVRALLGQRGYEFTDLSPSGNVVAMNERLGFRRINTATRLAINLPVPPTRRTRLSENPEDLSRTLRDSDRQLYLDHRHAKAAHHLLIERDDAYAYLVFRRDRRRGVPVFATPLYAGGERDVLRAAWPFVASRLLLRHGLAATLAEPRLLGFTPPVGPRLRHPRPRMVRGSHVLDAVDYLYSELALVSW